MKRLFICLGILGVVAICVLAFKIPADPYVIIPAISPMNFDKPLWANIILCGGFLYLITLYGIYDELFIGKEF